MGNSSDENKRDMHLLKNVINNCCNKLFILSNLLQVLCEKIGKTDDYQKPKLFSPRKKCFLIWFFFIKFFIHVKLLLLKIFLYKYFYATISNLNRMMN